MNEKFCLNVQIRKKKINIKFFMPVPLVTRDVRSSLIGRRCPLFQTLDTKDADLKLILNSATYPDISVEHEDKLNITREHQYHELSWNRNLHVQLIVQIAIFDFFLI